jgi:hypothetical protein
MSAAFNAILANSASTLVGYVLMVFMYVYPNLWRQWGMHD